MIFQWKLNSYQTIFRFMMINQYSLLNKSIYLREFLYSLIIKNLQQLLIQQQLTTCIGLYLNIHLHLNILQIQMEKHFNLVIKKTKSKQYAQSQCSNLQEIKIQQGAQSSQHKTNKIKLKTTQHTSSVLHITNQQSSHKSSHQIGHNQNNDDNHAHHKPSKFNFKATLLALVYKIRVLRSTKQYNYCYQGLTILLIVALGLQNSDESHALTRLSTKIQYFCHCGFIIFVAIRLLSMEPVHAGWCITQFIAFTSGLSTLFVHAQTVSKFLHALSCIRAIIIVRVTSLFVPFTKFVNAFKNVSTVVLPVIILVYLFSLIGLFAFAKNYTNNCDFILSCDQLTQYKYNPSQQISCTENQCPVINTVTQLNQCITYQSITRLLSRHNEQVYRTNEGYQLLLYKNILYSFYNTYKIVFVAGWSKIASIQRQKSNQIFVFVYYLTFLYLVSFIYMNIFYGAMLNNEQDNAHIKVTINIQQEDIKSKVLISTVFKERMTNKKIASNNSIQNDIRMLQQQINLDPDFKKNLLLIAIKPQIKNQEKIGTFLYQNEQISANQDRVAFLTKDYYLPDNQNYKKFAQQLIQFYRKLDLLFILFCCLNMCIQTQAFSFKNSSVKNWIDLVCIGQIFVTLLLKVICYEIKFIKLTEWCNKNNVQTPFNLLQYDQEIKLQLIISIFTLAGLINQIFYQPTISILSYPQSRHSKFFRIIKYARVYKFLILQNFLKQTKILVESIRKILLKLRSYIIFYFLMLFLFSLIGFNIFHQRNQTNLDNSFRQIYTSFIYVFMIFCNEYEQSILFQQYPIYGPLVIVFHIICITIGLTILSKYFMTIFLSQLLDQLERRNQILNKDCQSKASQKQCLKNQQPQPFSTFSFNNKIIDTYKLGSQQEQKSKNNKINELIQEQQSQQDKSFMRNIKMRCQNFFNSNLFFVIRIAVTILAMIEVGIRSPLINRQSNLFKIFQKVQKCLCIYSIFQIMLQIFCFGVICNGNSYFKRNKINILNFCITAFCVCSLIPNLSKYQFIYRFCKLKVLRIVLILNEFAMRNFRMKLTIIGFLKFLPKLMWFLLIVIAFYSFFALLFVAVLKNKYYYCVNNAQNSIVVTKLDCFNWGGDWINNPVSLDYNSMAILKIVIASLTQSWDTLVQPIARINMKGENLQPNQKSNSFIYFLAVLGYLVGSYIILNLFIGYSLYQMNMITKKLTGQCKLNQSQLSYLNMKQQIRSIVLTQTIKPQPNSLKFWCNKLMQFKVYKIIKVLFLCAFFIVSSSLTEKTQNQKIILIFKIQSVIIFSSLLFFIVEQIGRLKKIKIWFILFNLVFYGYSVAFFYMIFIHKCQINQTTMMLSAILIALKLIDFWLYINQFEFIKNILKYLNIILPRAKYILLLMLVVLLLYTFLSMQLFAFTKSTSSNKFLDDYTTFFSALFTLINFSTWQSPFSQIINTSQLMSPNFVCFNVNCYQDYLIYGKTGCGSKAKAYIFFLSFHLIYTMILHSALMANILQSYNEVKQRQIIFLKQFEFDKVTQQWLNFDQKATGFISSQNFWVFAQKLYRIYSVCNNQAMKPETKYKFLNALNIKLMNKDKQIGFEFYQTVQELARVLLTRKYKKEIKTTKADQIYIKLNSDKRNKQIKQTRFKSKDLFSIIILRKLLLQWRNIGAIRNSFNRNNFRNKVVKSICEYSKTLQIYQY